MKISSQMQKSEYYSSGILSCEPLLRRRRTLVMGNFERERERERAEGEENYKRKWKGKESL